MQVFVYFNLHKKVWSIKALEGENKGRVIGHARSVLLADVKPKVSEAGRQRVIQEKRKNVHAGITGQLIQSMSSEVSDELKDTLKAYHGESVEVTYNPYKYTSFVDKKHPEDLLSKGNVALMEDKRVHVYKPYFH